LSIFPIFHSFIGKPGVRRRGIRASFQTSGGHCIKNNSHCREKLNHGIEMDTTFDAVATMASKCIPISMPWSPWRRNGYHFRCHGHHGDDLDTTFDAVATTATNWIPLSMPWPPWRRIGCRFRCRGHHGVELDTAFNVMATMASNCKSPSIPGIPRRQSITRFCLRGGPGVELAGRATSGVIPVPTFQIPPHPRNRLPCPTLLHCKNPRPSRGVPSMAMVGLNLFPGGKTAISRWLSAATPPEPRLIEPHPGRDASVLPRLKILPLGVSGGGLASLRDA